MQERRAAGARSQLLREQQPEGEVRVERMAGSAGVRLRGPRQPAVEGVPEARCRALPPTDAVTGGAARRLGGVDGAARRRCRQRPRLRWRACHCLLLADGEGCVTPEAIAKRRARQKGCMGGP